MWTLEPPNWPFRKSTAYDAGVLFLLSSTFQARRKLLTPAQTMVNQKVLHFSAGPAAGRQSCSQLQAELCWPGWDPARCLGSHRKGSATSSEPVSKPWQCPHLVTALKTDPSSCTQHSTGGREGTPGKGDFFQMRNQQQLRIVYWQWPLTCPACKKHPWAFLRAWNQNSIFSIPAGIFLGIPKMQDNLGDNQSQSRNQQNSWQKHWPKGRAGEREIPSFR